MGCHSLTSRLNPHNTRLALGMTPSYEAIQGLCHSWKHSLLSLYHSYRGTLGVCSATRFRHPRFPWWHLVRFSASLEGELVNLTRWHLVRFPDPPYGFKSVGEPDMFPASSKSKWLVNLTRCHPAARCLHSPFILGSSISGVYNDWTQ